MSRAVEAGVVFVGAVVALLLAIRLALPYVAPFLFALLLFALIDAPVNRIEALGLSRTAAVALVLGLLALVCCGATMLVIVRLLEDANRLLEQLPLLSITLQATLSELAIRLDQFTAGLPPPVADLIFSAAGRLTQAAELIVQNTLAALVGVPSFLASFTVAMLATFFLARDGRLLARAMVQNLPASWRRRSSSLKREIFLGMVGFVRAQVLLMLLSGVLSTAVFLLFRLPYAWLLGVAAGVLDLVPAIGPAGIFCPVSIWLWFVGRKGTAVAMVAAWGLIMLVRQVIEPALLGSHVGLHPLTSLAAMYMGIQAWGVVGVFAGPLLALSIKVLWLGALKPLWIERE